MENWYKFEEQQVAKWSVLGIKLVNLDVMILLLWLDYIPS